MTRKKRHDTTACVTAMAVILSSAFICNASAQQDRIHETIIAVPSGLLAAEPIISDATFERIARKNNLSSKKFDQDDLKKLDDKFNNVIRTLKKKQVFEKIESISKKYGISPESVAACIIGEHVFNVSLIDTFQEYFVGIYSDWLDKHDSVHDLYISYLQEPDVSTIANSKSISDYDKWTAIFDLYNSKYRGTKNYPNKSFLMTFFNPYGAGLTYGLGQLSPTRILLTNDIAMRMGGLPRISPTDIPALYRATLDVDTNIHYIAATVVAEIDNYKKHANFDISDNIGILSTLFNLGTEKQRAISLGTRNKEAVKKGKPIEYPVENFYGWYMNMKERDIKDLFGQTPQEQTRKFRHGTR